MLGTWSVAPHYSILALEHDHHRARDFAPLAEVPADKIVVLGLMSIQWDVREPQNRLIARINEAAHYVPRDRRALSK